MTMRVFICAFSGFSLAVQMDSVSSLMLYTKKISKTIMYNPDNGNTYVSLPQLFKCPSTDTRHGIIIKNGNNDFDKTTENKIILLTTEVEDETDIPVDQIYPLPKICKSFCLSVFFNGILFNANNHTDPPTLFLDTGTLVKYIQRKLAV